jgi:hypothetical protein
MNAADVNAKIAARYERPLSSSVLKVYEQQRRALDTDAIIKSGSVSERVVEEWRGRFETWFLASDRTLSGMWRHAVMSAAVPFISKGKMWQVKFAGQKLYDKWLRERAARIGVELANVNKKVIGEVLKTRGNESWTLLRFDLKRCIGLNKPQTRAFAKQSDFIRANYPAEQADVLIDRLYREKINYRAQLIARTELINGVNDAQQLDIKARIDNGDLPQNMTKEWVVRSGESVNVCDICDANAEQGPIPIDEAFQSGDKQPGAHPGCHCGLQYAVGKGVVKCGK